MSRAIKLPKLTSADRQHLKFGGAAKIRARLENIRIMHTPIGDALKEILPLSEMPIHLHLGYDQTLLTPDQATTLKAVQNAATAFGLNVTVDAVQKNREAGARILLTHNRPMTFNEFSDKTTKASRQIVYRRHS